MQPSNTSPEDDPVAAFYARVMQRVCASFRELDASSNADVIALIEMKWRYRVACYTGIQWQEAATTLVPLDASPSTIVDPNAETVEAPRNDVTSTREIVSGNVALDTSALANNVRTEHRPPQRSAAEGALGSIGNSIVSSGGPPQSIFAKMLGAKRKISQMDGTNEDEDGDSDGAVETAESPEPAVSPSGEDSVTSDVLTTSSSEVSAVLAPVWGLPVSGFPSQLSARSAKFKYRRKFRDFHGRLSAIILTLTRPLLSRDIVHPGHFLWLNDERAGSGGEAASDGSKGRMVEVVRLSSERLDEIYVKLPDGSAIIVNKASTQRFYEYIIARGVLQLAA